MNDTVFEKIIKGEIPCTKIYEDDDFFSILDINPVSKGHTLILTKKSYPWIQDVPDEIIGKIFIKTKYIISSLKKATYCDYVKVLVEGIQVPHFHIHLIPSNYDHPNAKWDHAIYEDGEKEIFAEKIKSFLL